MAIVLLFSTQQHDDRFDPQHNNTTITVELQLSLGLLLCQLWPALFGHLVFVLWLGSHRGFPDCESFLSEEFGPFVRCSRTVSPGCENLLHKCECALLLQQRIAPNRVSERRIDLNPCR